MYIMALYMCKITVNFLMKCCTKLKSPYNTIQAAAILSICLCLSVCHTCDLC